MLPRAPAADAAVEAAEAAHSVSEGIKDKSDASKAKTQELYDKAVQSKEVVDQELQPTLDFRKSQVTELETKNKVTKQQVEAIIKKARKRAQFHYTRFCEIAY